MAKSGQRRNSRLETDGASQITRFEIAGLFGRPLAYSIDFPISQNKGEPSLLILAGPNGSGKTTILRMIEGMLDLDFDVFRQIPFDRATLYLSTGDRLNVRRQDNSHYPLRVTFGGMTADLARSSNGPYSEKADQRREAFRERANSILSTVSYSLLDIHRSIALRTTDPDDDDDDDLDDEDDAKIVFAADISPVVQRRMLDAHPRRRARVLSQRVKNFVRDAQVNYRKFFEAGQLELLPRILERLNQPKRLQKKQLRAILADVRSSSLDLKRMGLQTDEADEQALTKLLSDRQKFDDAASLAVLEAYVEMQRNRAQTRALIATRLRNFEEIMAEFLVGKSVRVHATDGLQIRSGKLILRETDLSSGEYHFLYMMVTALLCLRAGTIIAIDEPEMSLHVTWQRKVVSALAKCAEGASPLFIFATHSAAISAEHRDRVKTLGRID